MFHRMILLGLLLFVSPSFQTLYCPPSWDCQNEGSPCGKGCASGLYCSSSNSNSNPEAPTSNDAVCVRSNIGAPCSSYLDCHGDFVNCVGNAGNKQCRLLKNPGQDGCTEDFECAGISGRCVNGKCHVAQQGERCSSDRQCQDATQVETSPNVCGPVPINDIKTCQTPVGVGAECLTTQNPGPCQFGLYCDASHHCKPRSKPGDACIRDPTGSHCMFSSCLPTGAGGAYKCTPRLSVAAGQQLCGPTLGCKGFASYCQSMMLDSKTGKCMEYTPPSNFGNACNTTQDCNTATDTRLICQCTTPGSSSSAPGTCVNAQTVVGLPYFNACLPQISAIITSCKITDGIANVLTPPYPLGTDGLEGCCRALKEAIPCLQQQPYAPGLAFGDSMMKCNNNRYSWIMNRVCSGKSFMFTEGH